MALRIRIEHGQDAGKTYRLVAAGVYRIGRSPQGSFQVLDMKVSKDHFEIHHDGAGATVVRDLGSSHGTLLNGQRVDGTRPLNPGDEIRVGLTVLRSLSDGPGDAEVKPVEALPTGAATSTTTAATGAPTSSGAPRPGGKPAVADPLVNTTLAGYRILQRVGAGGMGAVYRAEQMSLHREVALKVLAEKLVSDSAFVDQFVNEARAAGQLNHPNVVQVYDVGHADGRHFFSMEFIHGGALEEKIPKGGGAPFEEALPWFLDAANALIFAEKKGILHRDIKPDNFMVGQDGSVKLCDLGLAKKSESADLLAQGIIGTPHFIAPEAIRRKSDVDRRADLYSLGCTFYRILTGKNPYPAPSVKEILLAHLNQPVPRVAASVPQVPRDLDDVVFKLMQKDPAARYQGATELWEALDKIRLQLGMAAHGLHPGRAKKIAIFGGVMAVAAIGVAGYFVMKEPATKTEYVDRPGGGAKVIGEDPAKVRALEADKAFSQIESGALRELGSHDDGENWKKPGWRAVITALREMADKFQGTEGATRALDYAKQIDELVAKRLASSKAYEAAIAKASADLKTAADDGLKAAEAKSGDPLAAERALDEALAATKKLGASKHDDGRGLLTPAEVAGQAARLEAARESLAAAVTASWAATGAKAADAAVGGSAEALDRAIALLTSFVDAHPKADGAGAVAAAWNSALGAATTARGTLEAQRRKALRADFLADRGSYFEFLLKEAFAPTADDGSGGGLYRRFQFAEAGDKAADRAKAARTPAYRELFARRAAEARAIGRLPGVLAAGFGAKGFKEKVTGRGWAGVPKAFTAEGVQAADKLRPYSDEGLGWFADLFFEKGGERYPLTADDHEALAYVCEAAGIYDDPDKFAVALASLDKAAALDPARAERLGKRRKAVEEEQAIASLIGESEALVKTVAEKLAAYGDLSPMKPAESQKARNDVIASEPDLRTKLVTARAKLDEAERSHLTTVLRAWLGDRPPPGAAYAGEQLPTDAEPPAPPPAGVPPAPAPKDGPVPPEAPMDGSAPGSGTAPGAGNPAVKDPPPPAMADAPGAPGTTEAPGMGDGAPTGGGPGMAEPPPAGPGLPRPAK